MPVLGVSPEVGAWCVFAVGVGFFVIDMLFIYRARVTAEKTKRTYERLLMDQLAQAGPPEGVHMCGGCGKYLPQESIDACRGVLCHRYLEGLEAKELSEQVKK